MSNHARRRHLHRASEQRAVEARQRYAAGEQLFAPGSITDRTPETLQRAMDEAHEILPYVPGTQVCVTVYDVDDGLKLIGDMFGDEAAVMVATKLLAEGGSCPAVIVSTRQPHEHGHECGHA